MFPLAGLSALVLASAQSVIATEGYAAVKPGCKHGPHSRGCWKDGFDINTDYEKKIPPGKLVEVGIIAE